MTVLALEFRAVRETADFGFLATEFPLNRLDPIGRHVAGPLTVRRQAAELAAGKPGTVLAYCSCAALGAHIAELSGADLVLIDADAVTPEAVRRDVTAVCASLGAPPADDVEIAFAAVRDELAAVHGADDQAFEMVDELFGRYRAWLRFLAAAAAAEPAAPAGEVTVIAGKRLPALENLLADPDRARVRRFTPEQGTLESPEVRAFLRNHLLGRGFRASVEIPVAEGKGACASDK